MGVCPGPRWCRAVRATVDVRVVRPRCGACGPQVVPDPMTELPTQLPHWRSQVITVSEPSA
jgi:hypothetical protein